jgi:uncharacterized membrane protein
VLIWSWPDLEFGRKLFRLAPIIYLAIALPTSLFLSTLIPPFQAPDETTHFRRAVQLLRGQIIGQVHLPIEAGGALPKNVMRVAEAFDFMIGHSDVKVRPDVTVDTRKLPWNWRDREYTSFVNTVIYPPIGYVPAVFGIWVGRSIGFAILDSYYLGRYCNAIASVLLASFAIYIARWGRSIFYVLLSLPMTLYLFASLTQDALLISMTALALSFYSRAAGEGRDVYDYECYLSALLLGCVWAARPPYVFLCPILLSLRSLRSISVSPSQKLLKKILPFAIAIGIGGAWILFGALPAKVPFRLAEGVSAKHQLHYVMHHPSALFIPLYNTLKGVFVPHFEQFIGTLGWTDTYLAGFYYWLACCALLIAGLASLVQGWMIDRPQYGKFNLGILFAAASLVTWAAIYGTEYLFWTKVGADTIEGIQGRYFLPSSMALAVAVPAFGSSLFRFGSLGPGTTARVQASAWTILLAIVIFLDFILPHAVLVRYYG